MLVAHPAGVAQRLVVVGEKLRVLVGGPADPGEFDLDSRADGAAGGLEPLDRRLDHEPGHGDRPAVDLRDDRAGRPLRLRDLQVDLEAPVPVGPDRGEDLRPRLRMDVGAPDPLAVVLVPHQVDLGVRRELPARDDRVRPRRSTLRRYREFGRRLLVQRGVVKVERRLVEEGVHPRGRWPFLRFGHFDRPRRGSVARDRPERGLRVVLEVRDAPVVAPHLDDVFPDAAGRADLGGRRPAVHHPRHEPHVAGVPGDLVVVGRGFGPEPVAGDPERPAQRRRRAVDLEVRPDLELRPGDGRVAVLDLDPVGPAVVLGDRPLVVEGAAVVGPDRADAHRPGLVLRADDPVCLQHAPAPRGRVPDELVLAVGPEVPSAQRDGVADVPLVVAQDERPVGVLSAPAVVTKRLPKVA